MEKNEFNDIYNNSKITKNLKILYVSITFSILRLSLFIVLTYFLLNKLVNTTTEVYEDNSVYEVPINTTMKFTFIFMFIFALFIYVILSINSIINYFYNTYDFKSNIFSSIIALNIEILVIYLINLRFNKMIISKDRLKIIDITIISLLLALFEIFDFVTGLVPPIPFGITLPFKYMIIFFGCYLLSFSKSLLLCLLCAFITLINPATYKLSVLQFLFDYWIPTVLMSISCFFKPKKSTNNKMLRAISFLNFIIIPFIIMFICRSISGVVYWLNPNVNGDVYFEFNWDNRVAYSFIYNGINTLFDLIILLSTVPLVCTTLDFIKQKYYPD
ncbi:energy-coupled thiamine transporter ThiT [Spiroplasma turonicum]|uniref:Transmembrane protein n=1 Tax=Spiroplasma turonicum TaxID=216946 RepID=A0A0K1P7V1_9MOLU|nr:energy-coupled thiamine transporter ThiT [Spiroplasma turonicum]AKU79962.1 hypothetical protein STURON_00716 [Spiroplasma turonicum]ALX70975.1 hypothetical protein STURO_v1c07160 [Spiroplasma turonicum]